MKNPTSFLGLGTAALGRPQYINIRTEKTEKFFLETFRQKGIEILNTAYELGIRYFDTAPGYGLAEQLLIDWVAKKNDSTITIATKWGYTYVANFDPNASIHEVKEHSLEKLNAQWQQSKNLLPNLNVYQIHSATLETGVLRNEKILHRLAELKSQHNLLIGITTTGVNQTEVIKKALDVNVAGFPLFDLFQVTYNIFDQSLATISRQLNTLNKKLVIKEALANGRIFPNAKYPHYAKVYKILEKLSGKYGVGVDAIALRFCMDSINVFKVLSGAANELHLTDNLRVGKFELEEGDIEKLKEAGIFAKEYWGERSGLGWN